MTSRSVLREIAAQLEAAAEQDPCFWTGLREELGRARMEQGARHHRAIQTADPLMDVAVQVAPSTEERATQTDQAAEACHDLSDFEESEARGEERPPTNPWPPGGCGTVPMSPTCTASVPDPVPMSPTCTASVPDPGPPFVTGAVVWALQ
ncbi:odd-skipped protein [Lasius niger]|uniref:Odd-skipped protein n=1 Tax=Lasius niger TaxID=67767 RepID=A0A0J7KAR2_LASNI|nr:odd-skipped protein [Lasius niger]